MESINLKELYFLQKNLDEEIANNHHVTYESTFSRRLLALIVEIGELGNETRCFKYWSNKGPSTKDVIMDEYADGLHFLLSLGIPLNVDVFEYNLEKLSDNLTELFLLLYKAAISLKDDYTIKNYVSVMQLYLNIALSLDMTSIDIINAYKKKLSINYKRQETNY